jgi:hypothetical protein
METMASKSSNSTLEHEKMDVDNDSNTKKTKEPQRNQNKRQRTQKNDLNDTNTAEKATPINTTKERDINSLPKVDENGFIIAEPVHQPSIYLHESVEEKEMDHFHQVLDDLLTRTSSRDLVKKTAEYIKQFPQFSIRFQIKLKQRALNETTKQFNVKIMLFYVLHEFIKSFDGEEFKRIQKEWFPTVDEVLHACVREMRNVEDGRKKLLKTLARWEELEIYPSKIKTWKNLVLGETKPRRAPARLPRTEAERIAELPEQIQNQPKNRMHCPFLFERTSSFRSEWEQKQHWRYTGIAFANILAESLNLNVNIKMTAFIYFHRIFDRGIYAKERYKVAAACIFLAAKASSKRMKLLKMVRTMYEILEKPLMFGDEEILDLERLHLLHYEMEVLKGINYDLTIQSPVKYLDQILTKMPKGCKFVKNLEVTCHIRY